MSQNRKEHEKQQLPPCEVCGGVSSGFHFGAMTCESCKVFFRRSLLRDTSYFCHHKEKCILKSGKRTNCSFCRLKKCLDSGMSRDGSKKGRYSLERKEDYKTTLEQLKDTENRRQEEEEMQKQTHERMIKDTIERLKNLHDAHRMVTPEAVERVKMGELRKKELLNQLEESVGPTPPITSEDAMEFFRATGVDITGYRSASLTHAKTCPELITAQFVNYLNDLEEYTSLSVTDQIVTLKGAVRHWLWISTYEVLNTEEYMMTCLMCGTSLTEEECRIFKDSEDFKAIFKPTIKMKELNLTDTEKAILRALVIFDTSQCDDVLQEPETIDKHQDLFLECLLHVMEESRGEKNAAMTFAYIVYALTEARSLMIGHKEDMNKAIEVLHEVKCSKLIAEVFDMPESVVEELGTDFDYLQLV